MLSKDMDIKSGRRESNATNIRPKQSYFAATLFTSPRAGEVAFRAQHEKRVRGGFDVFSSFVRSASEGFRETLACAAG